MTEPTRRDVMVGTGAAAAAMCLAACVPSAEERSRMASTAVPERSVELARTSDVPVGGGTVVAARELALTQPVAGEFHAFSALCTHQNCSVSRFTGTEIGCPCHGSTFDARTGEVLSGPATLPLYRVEIEVDGDRIVSVV